MELCRCFAENSVHGGWGLKQGWAQLQDPCPPYSHNSTSLIGFVYKGFPYDFNDERILLLKKRKAFKNANHQHLGKDEDFGGQRTTCSASNLGLLT